MKLWKALFYGLWSADVPKVQYALCDKLVSVLVTCPAQAYDYYEAFLQTIIREWPKLDRYRLNKYYHLVKQFFTTTAQISEKEPSTKLKNLPFDYFFAASCPLGLKFYFFDYFFECYPNSTEFIDILLTYYCQVDSKPVAVRLMSAVLEKMEYDTDSLEKIKQYGSKCEKLSRRKALYELYAQKQSIKSISS